MPVFKVVEFWPTTGLPSHPWVDDPDADAFTRTSRRVCELYSEGLAPASLTGRAQALRLFAVRGPDGSEAVEVEVHEHFYESFEVGSVGVPVGVAGLAPDVRALLVLDVVHAATTKLAQVRGWPEAALEIARQHVLDHHFRFEWATAWKSNKNRAYRARAVFYLTDDGTGRVALEVCGVKTGALVARSPEVLAFSTIEGFKRSARTLRWDGGSVEVIGSIDPWGGRGAALRLDVDDQPAEGARDQMAATSGIDTSTSDVDGTTAVAELEGRLPQVHVRGVQVVPDAHEIRVVGGGPTNGIPVAYLRALDFLLEGVQRDFAEWWSRADRSLLEIWYEFGPGAEGPTVRRTKDKVIARIHRAPRTIQSASEPVELARDDVIALSDALGAKLGLGPAPSLPSSTQVHRQVAEQQEASERYKKVGSELLERLRGRLPNDIRVLFLQDLREPEQVEIGSGLRFNIARNGVTLDEGEQHLLDQL